MQSPPPDPADPAPQSRPIPLEPLDPVEPLGPVGLQRRAANHGRPPTEAHVPLSAWLKSLWPRRHELQIARRYLFRYAPSRSLLVLSAFLLLLTAGAEVLYFVVPGYQSAQVGFLALILPLCTIASLLLNVLSVFSTVAVVGVVLGVAALTVVMSVTSGFQTEIRNRVIGLNAHVLLLKYGTDFSEYNDVAKKVAAHPQVIASSPFIYNEMLIAKEGALSSGVLVKGIDPERSRAVLNLERWLEPLPGGGQPALSELVTERAPDAGGPPLPGLFIGSELRKKLKAKVGDRLRLIAPLVGLDVLVGEDAAQQGGPQPPRSQEFRVAGVFTAGFDEYDRRLVIVGLRRAQDLVGQGDVVTGVEVKTRDVMRARLLGGEIVQLLGGAPYRSLDWEELNHNLFTALAMQKTVLTIVLFLIIIVAAFNIVASLTMMVIDKTREVAILKAMGMSAPGVASVFRIAGMTIGLLGTSLGVGMGVLVCGIIQRLGYLLDAKVYMIDRLPTELSVTEPVVTGVVTIVISLLATLYPSLRAARMRPVDGLRED